MTLSIVMPFYRNSLMLAHHYANWASYAPMLKAEIEIVLVDDGSPEPAVDVYRPSTLPPLRIYRVLKDIPWHQHGARNLGAKEAQGPWLFLTDMDHLLPPGSLWDLLTRIESAKPGTVYTFGRLDAPDLKPTRNDRGELKPHVNSFAMTKELFWKVGGYDEDCVGYGTDGYFRGRLWAMASRRVHLAHVPIIRYAREVIADASTRPETPMDPRAFRNAGRRSGETSRRMAVKRAHGGKPKVLDFAWERAL